MQSAVNEGDDDAARDLATRLDVMMKEVQSRMARRAEAEKNPTIRELSLCNSDLNPTGTFNKLRELSENADPEQIASVLAALNTIASLVNEPYDYYLAAMDIRENGLHTTTLLAALPLVTATMVKCVSKGGRQAGQYLSESWHQGTFPNKMQSIQYHVAKHGKGRTPTQYTKDAMEFFKQNKHLGQNVILKDGTAGIKIQVKTQIGGKTQRIGGYWTSDGRLVTFWD